LISSRAGRITALLAVTAIAVGACSSSGSSPSASAAASAAAPSVAASAAPPASAPASAAASQSGALKVTFIPKQINNPYFDAAKVGADKAAGELGGTVTQVGPSAATEAQASFIQDATTQGVSAIAISANDPNAVVPALTAAKAAGIKVVGYDSSPAAGAYDVFVNQTDFSLIGGAMAQWACDLAPDCSGEIAILSATATATNQNAWIADFNKALTTDPKFAKLKLVDTVYGDDDATKSTNVANGLLQTHPNLKVIVAPTTVGILAAAQVVKQAGSAVKVTGLGLPNDMKSFVADGTVPEFGLWSVPDLGYLAYYVAAKLITGEIKGTPGETFTVPNLNDGKPYTIGDKSVVILGPPFVFNKDNVNNFDF
jgi:rhamnose transport system substrate-binding protein